MNLKEFERQVLAGEITDFEPYFKEQWDHDQREQRYILAKNGIETDHADNNRENDDARATLYFKQPALGV